MKLSHWFCLFLILHSTLAGAEEQTSAGERHQTSAEIRAGKTLVYGVSLPGVFAGYYHSADVRYLLSYQYGKYERDDFYSKDQYVEAIVASAQWFPFNSFNLRMGLGYLRMQDIIRYRLAYNPVSGRTYTDNAYRDTRAGLFCLAAGNEWHWQNFFFGIEWFENCRTLSPRSNLGGAPSGVKRGSNEDIKRHPFFITVLSLQFGVSL